MLLESPWHEILCDMDYMDPEVHCLRKAVKLNKSANGAG